MYLATAKFPHGTVSAAGSLHGDMWSPLPFPSVSALLGSPSGEPPGSLIFDLGSPVSQIPTADLQFRNPLPHPSKILCCGLNYADHIAEMGRPTPKYPTLFAKFADTLTDPTADIFLSAADQMDWEGELAVVVGGKLKRATPEQAERSILGYTVANDISLRNWQHRTSEWLQGKAFPGTTPLGPVIVTASSIDPVRGLLIETLVNQDLVQRSNTAELVFTPSFLLSYISHFTPLRRGDVILTGTPSGVGASGTPPRFLTPGDLLTTRIEHIGELRNRIIPNPVERKQSC